MAVRVVGAGLGRTGTTSLKFALESLLGEPCYHFRELDKRPGDAEVWLSLVNGGEQPDWKTWFAGYGATLDWPAAAYWQPIAGAHPDAFVLLSTRATSDEWYESYRKTIVPVLLDETKFATPAHQVARLVTYRTFTEHIDDADVAKAAYERHNAAVRAAVPPDRLIEWQPADGWGPLCAALNVPVPDAEFPRSNSAHDFEIGARRVSSRRRALRRFAGRAMRRLRAKT